jgi:hypothetical protein
MAMETAAQQAVVKVAAAMVAVGEWVVKAATVAVEVALEELKGAWVALVAPEVADMKVVVQEEGSDVATAAAEAEAWGETALSKQRSSPHDCSGTSSRHWRHPPSPSHTDEPWPRLH